MRGKSGAPYLHTARQPVDHYRFNRFVEVLAIKRRGQAAENPPVASVIGPDVVPQFRLIRSFENDEFGAQRQFSGNRRSG